MPDSFTDALPAVLALDCVLNEIVMGKPLVDVGKPIECEAYGKEGDALVDERAASSQRHMARVSRPERSIPVGHDDGTIILRLLEGVVASGPVVVRAMLQDRELLLHVPVEWQDDGDWRHENVSHEFVHQRGEGSR